MLYIIHICISNSCYHQGGEGKYKSPVHSSNGQSSRAFQKSMSVDPDSVDADEVKSKKVGSLLAMLQGCCSVQFIYMCTVFILNFPQTHTRASSDVRAPPVAPPFKAPSRSIKPVESLEHFKELAQHRKGLFRKKVTIANMLCWTRVGHSVTVI